MPGMNNYAKVNSYTYIMPTWSLQELLDYNHLLDDKIKLAEEVLISRYYNFGGIPRSIFTDTDRENNMALEEAIRSFNVFDFISYPKSGNIVQDGKSSHHVLEMDIAEKVVNRLKDDSLQRLFKFAIAQLNDDSGGSSALQGRIYEILCHRWFNLRKQEYNLKLCLLGSEKHVELTIPADMPANVHFSTLADIPAVSPGLTYYQPKSKTFSAVEAFILDGDNKRCYGLHLTLNLDHGIKSLPLKKFVHWLESEGIPESHLYFCFVVPSTIVPSFQKQKILTKTNAIHLRAERLASVEQYVILYDVFLEIMQGDYSKKK